MAMEYALRQNKDASGGVDHHKHLGELTGGCYGLPFLQFTVVDLQVQLLVRGFTKPKQKAVNMEALATNKEEFQQIYEFLTEHDYMKLLVKDSQGKTSISAEVLFWYNVTCIRHTMLVGGRRRC